MFIEVSKLRKVIREGLRSLVEQGQTSGDYEKGDFSFSADDLSKMSPQDFNKLKRNVTTRAATQTAPTSTTSGQPSDNWSVGVWDQGATDAQRVAAAQAMKAKADQDADARDTAREKPTKPDASVPSQSTNVARPKRQN